MSEKNILIPMDGRFITRDEYPDLYAAIKEAYKPMTVKELIDKLKLISVDTEIRVGCYTSGIHEIMKIENIKFNDKDMAIILIK